MNVTFPFRRGHIMIPPVRIRHKYSYRPLMAMDTGARFTVISPRIAKEVGIDPTVLKPTVQIVGIAGSAWAVETTLASVSILGMPVENVKAIIHQLPTSLGLDGILGLNFLRHFNITINHDAENVSIEKCNLTA